MNDIDNVFVPKGEDIVPEDADKISAPVMETGEALDLVFKPDTSEEASLAAPDIAGTELAVPDSTDAQGDLAHVQSNLKQLIKTGNQSVRDLYSLAKQTDHPRAYEALTLLIQTIAGVNKDLIEFHEKKQKLEAIQAQQAPTTNVTNNTLVLSTSDLQKMIMNMRDV